MLLQCFGKIDVSFQFTSVYTQNSQNEQNMYQVQEETKSHSQNGCTPVTMAALSSSSSMSQSFFPMEEAFGQPIHHLPICMSQTGNLYCN